MQSCVLDPALGAFLDVPLHTMMALKMYGKSPEDTLSRFCDPFVGSYIRPYCHQENRLIHWTVEHPDDIARSNFLRGDHAHFFTNLDRVSVKR